MGAENGLTVRRATAPDAAAVAELAARTFTDAFAADNRSEDIAAHVSRWYGERQQRSEIEDPEIVTLLVEEHDRPIAYAQVRRAVAPPCVRGEKAIELARFYVDLPWHGRGVARLLMTAVERAARELGGLSLWLGVWERNPRAIAFYAKCGFRDAGSQIFIVGSDPQTDRVMVRPLADGQDTESSNCDERDQ
jgi:GNAT superfamily N-acetyltransferase